MIVADRLDAKPVQATAMIRAFHGAKHVARSVLTRRAVSFYDDVPRVEL